MIQHLEDQGQYCSSSSSQIINNNFEIYNQQDHQQFLLQQQNMQNTFSFPQGPTTNDHHQVSSPWSMVPQIHQNPFNPFAQQQQQSLLLSPYANLFNRSSSSRVHQFGYDHGGPSDLRIISDTLDHHHHHHVGMKMSAQEIMEAKALAASKSHSEAERRRRERINNHLAKLRSLLPSTTKTDKASLLAEVIQHVKELKRQTSLISETHQIPTESDELTVDHITTTPEDDEEGNSNNNNKFIIKASLCCDDRSDLLPELIKTLKALRLRTLKADITTLGGRVKNVLFITGEDYDPQEYCISSIQEALKAVMDKSNVAAGGDNDSSGCVKRQRTNIISISN